MSEKSFLRHLLDKQADVQAIGEQTSVNVSGAAAEVKRQIRECLRGGQPIKGEGVTKSGQED